MPRWTRLAAALTASSILLLGCGEDPDGTTTGDADAEVDTGTQSDRDTGTCTAEEPATVDSVDEAGEDPAGSTEDQQSCTPGNDADDTVGDGDVDAGGAPGVGTESDGSP